MNVFQTLLYKLTILRLKIATSRFRKLIPKQDLDHIDSLLGEMVYVGRIVDDSVAAAGIFENGKHWIGFCLPRLWYKSPDYLLVIVAHESAHVFLEHNRKGGLPEEEAEKAVHEQLKLWRIKEEYFTLYFPSKENAYYSITIVP